MQTGGAQPHVHPSDIAELKVAYISDITQQCRIADILSDMDKEIADLEARRDKYTQIKSGMMQKLLTGQIRLIHKRQARIIPLDAHIVAGHIVNKLHESRGWGRTNSAIVLGESIIIMCRPQRSMRLSSPSSNIPPISGIGLMDC